VENDEQVIAPASGGSDGEPSDNGQQPADMRLVAKAYRDLGWVPIPLRVRSKAPIAPKWTQQVVDDKTEWPGNIGVRLGAPSAGLVDVDLDCEEARSLAPVILPRTGTVFGRPGAQGSHWLYDCGASAPDAASTAARFSAGTGDKKEKQKPLLQLRSTGGQTMFPPSIHPNGERLEWARYEAPAKLEFAELARAAEILAAASLMLQNFPDEGMRFNAYAAVIGTMLRCGVDEDTVRQIVAVFVDRFRSPARTRGQSVKVLRERLDSGDGAVPGFPRLAEIFGEKVARRCRDWLEPDVDWHRSKNGIVPGSLHNMRLAMQRLDVRFRYNEFADQLLVTIGTGKRSASRTRS
jgi:putative DNA primase/helicase